MSYIKIDNKAMAFSTKLAKKVWLNVSGAPTKDDGYLILWADSAVSSNEIWVVRSITNANGKDYHIIIAASNGAALTYPGSTGGDSQIRTTPVNFGGDDRQLWAIYKDNHGYYLFESKVDQSAVLDVRGGETENATMVIAYQSHHTPSDNQYWTPWDVGI